MENLVGRFLDDEISSQELYQSIHDFITSYHIRSGEFEANYYVIKKMDHDNFIVFPENVFPDNHREIPNCFSIYKDDLIARINEHAKNQGFTVPD